MTSSPPVRQGVCDGPPTVSILIPAYNRAAVISQSIESALHQTNAHIEVVIGDNHSTDGTWDVIQRYAKRDSRIRAFRNESNIGPVRNWLRCATEAKGKYGKILWSDDLMAPTFVEKTLPFLQRHDDVGFVFSAREVFGDYSEDNCNVIGPTGIYESKVYFEGIIDAWRFPVSPGCALFRLETLRNNIILDVPNNIGSDFAMHGIGPDLLVYLLATSQYKRFAVVNEKLSFFRAHEGGISVASSKARLGLLYRVAIAYFVESYVDDRDLIKKVNAMFLISLMRYRRNELGLRRISDFYVANDDVSVDAGYLVVSFFRRIGRALARKFQRHARRLRL